MESLSWILLRWNCVNWIFMMGLGKGMAKITDFNHVADVTRKRIAFHKKAHCVSSGRA